MAVLLALSFMKSIFKLAFLIYKELFSSSQINSVNEYIPSVTILRSYHVHNNGTLGISDPIKDGSEVKYLDASRVL